MGDETTKSLFRHVAGAKLDNDGSVSVGWDHSNPVKFAEYPTKRKKDDNMHDENENDEEQSKRGKSLIENPVENDEPIPLIPNLDANAKHVITAIRVHKKTPPNDGIKGEVPPTTSIDFIARRWGDGIYDFEGLNQNHRVLRRNTNVKIAMGLGLGETPSSNQNTPKISFGGSGDINEKLLDRVDKENARATEVTDKALQTAQVLSQNYSEMVRADSKERADRDREYFKAQSDQQSTFFQSMIINMQQMHNQTVSQQRESFHQTMQMMQLSFQQMQSMNNPAYLLSLFREGLKFGSEINQEESDPFSTIIGGAVEGLREVKDMMTLQAGQVPAMLPRANSPNPQTKSLPQKQTKVTDLVSKEELIELIRLKKLAQNKGYDFNGLVKQAQAMVSNAPDMTAEEPDDESEKDNEHSEGDS